jgi:hypothetical protein
VIGDATVATVEKGRLWLDRAVAEVASYIEELAVREPRPGRDHHEQGAVPQRGLSPNSDTTEGSR